MESLSPALARRMARLVATWPASSAVLVRPYFRSASGPAPDGGRPWQEPYWLLLPAWLFRRAGSTTRRRLPKAFVGEIQWAQYCLFLFIRIQDDVLDGQQASPRLLFVADEFLLESERTFSRYLRHEQFWRFFRSSVARTVRGILEVDAAQRRPRGMTREMLWAHARVSSIFKVGCAAVCMTCRRPRDFGPVSRFMDQMAIGGQLLDDLTDVEEDLATGRLNSAARWLLGDSARQGRLPIAARLDDAILRTDRIDRLIGHVRNRLRRARRALAPLELTQASAYFDQAERDLHDLAQTTHRARVVALFSQARLPPSKRRVSAGRRRPRKPGD